MPVIDYCVDAADVAVAIAVPVRDEAEHLPHLFAALSAQRGAPEFRLCLFLDGCDDASHDVAAKLADAAPFGVRIAQGDRAGGANAGLARGKAMALAARAAPGGALLTTDADGEPAPGWVAASLAALAQADIVAGRIVRASGPPSAWQDRLELYYDRLHHLRRAIDPVEWEGDPTHHWTSGASLALRTATYEALGGFPPLASGEDAALCDAAARAGLRVRRDAHVIVHTSARRQGRASGGFAAGLALLDAGDHPPRVAHPEDEQWRYRMHAAARRQFGTGDHHALADALGLPDAEVTQVAGECRNGEAFAARIVGPPPGGMRTLPLCHAEALLAGADALRGAA